MTKPDSARADVTLRPLRAEDLDAVMAIDVASYATVWPADLVLAEVELEDRYHLVATVHDEVVAHGSLMFVLDEATLTTVAVDPAYRRRGIASALLAALVDDASRREVTAMTLEVRAGNDAALALYRRFGFQVEGRRKRYYEPDGEDALIMWRRGLDCNERTSDA